MNYRFSILVVNIASYFDNFSRADNVCAVMVMMLVLCVCVCVCWCVGIFCNYYNLQLR